MAAPKRPAGTRASDWEKLRNQAIKKAREEREKARPPKIKRDAAWEKGLVQGVKKRRARRQAGIQDRIKKNG